MAAVSLPGPVVRGWAASGAEAAGLEDADAGALGRAWGAPDVEAAAWGWSLSEPCPDPSTVVPLGSSTDSDELPREAETACGLVAGLSAGRGKVVVWLGRADWPSECEAAWSTVDLSTGC